ncbi:hypothetical protein ATY29_09410 [Rhizobium hidalgonense]|nr:hypothetical protein ATY29_09410 [Rhizobium hidalgonense]
MGQGAATDIDGMDQFQVPRIVVFEQWDQLPCRNLVGHMKQAHSGNAGPSQHHLLHRLAVVHDDRAFDRLCEIPTIGANGQEGLAGRKLNVRQS